MPSVNADVQPPAIDGSSLGDEIPQGFISVGAASSATTLLGSTGKSLDELDERQLAGQVR